MVMIVDSLGIYIAFEVNRYYCG